MGQRGTPAHQRQVQTHRGGCCLRGEGSDPPTPPPEPQLSPALVEGGLDKTGGGGPTSSGRERPCSVRIRDPFPLGLRGRRLGSPPTPEKVSFSLCIRVGLPSLSTLFIQTEAAGWFSHLCVCRYIDFVLKEDRLTPAGGGVFVLTPSVPSCPWGRRVPGELVCTPSIA